MARSHRLRTVQIHLRLPVSVSSKLRKIARRRCQTLSGAVEFLVLAQVERRLHKPPTPETSGTNNPVESQGATDSR